MKYSETLNKENLQLKNNAKKQLNSKCLEYRYFEQYQIT